jgi:probable rRNA maturation factor
MPPEFDHHEPDSPSPIDIQNDSNYPIDAARLIAAATHVIQQHDLDPNSAMTIVITNNAHITDLNREFRGVDSPTDVLSFPSDDLPDDLLEEMAAFGESEAPYLGDLIIAYPYVQTQAERQGHDLSDSLTLMVVHGTLHLIGYDHETLANQAEMWDAQAQALTALGISPMIVPALEDDTH